MNTTFIIESLDLSEAVLDAESRTVRQRLIGVGRSRNGRVYSAEVLQKAAPLFEGARTHVDHPTKDEMKQRPERSVLTMTGWITDVRFQEDGLYGTRHFWNNDAGRQVYEMVEQIKTSKAPIDGFGGSINALGKGTKDKDSGDLVVESINQVLSVDDVTTPAAGGAFLPLSASAGDDLMAAVLGELTYEEWFESRPDYRTRLQKEMKTTRQTSALKAAQADAEQHSQALTEAQTKIADLESQNARLLTEQESVRRELAIERALRGVKLSATWAESVRHLLMDADPEKWTGIINNEVTKAKQAYQQPRVAVSGAGYQESAPLPPPDPRKDVAPRDDEDAESWGRRVGFIK